MKNRKLSRKNCNQFYRSFVIYWIRRFLRFFFPLFVIFPSNYLSTPKRTCSLKSSRWYQNECVIVCCDRIDTCSIQILVSFHFIPVINFYYIDRLVFNFTMIMSKRSHTHMNFNDYLNFDCFIFPIFISVYRLYICKKSSSIIHVILFIFTHFYWISRFIRSFLVPCLV